MMHNCIGFCRKPWLATRIGKWIFNLCCIWQQYFQARPLFLFKTLICTKLQIAQLSIYSWMIKQLNGKIINLYFLFMIGGQKILSVLMVGRIYEQQAVFKLIENAAASFINSALTQFYLYDAKTLMKMSARHPQYICHEFNFAKHQKIIDYIITIGGDGTILYAAKDFINQVPPLISFQRGSLGFMCRFSQEDIKEVVQNIVAFHFGKIQFPFQKSTLMRLHATKSKAGHSQQPKLKSEKVCINEVYISRRTQERITIQISVNGEHLTHTAGDGILISTSTGSTAYSLSAGGPILQNGVNGILIVPIAPNSLSFRPICFPSDCEIRIKLHKISRSAAYVCFDGQSTEDFDFDHQILIRKAKNDIIFFEPKKEEARMPSWIQRLKFFLGWNQKYKSPEVYVPQINTHYNKKECMQDD